ncbi:hypothetical protein C4565_04215 [Candidatus Parcubacteria bacterium]|nr:MAG: hypothetical protein C4565_04215 [Candidatus Parcubacteria bacterium]
MTKTTQSGIFLLFINNYAEEENMNIPYDKMELVLALYGIEQRMSDEEFNKVGEEIKAKLEEKLPNEETSINILIAKQNGISIEELISSPNLKLLQAQYYESIYSFVLMELQEKMKLTKKEAYAILAELLGLLDGSLYD